MIRRATWKHVFGLAVVVGALHMLFYAWWVPPWQFPDEPRHFEYVRLVGEWGRTAGYNEEDPSLQAAIIRSMARFDFWRFGFAIGGYVQHRDQVFAEIWLPGYKNVHGHAPLYYILMGIGLSFLPRDALLTQLFLTRLLSVLLGTLSLLLIGFTGYVLRGWRLAAGLTIFAALLPGHAFINASVNNDVLAETFSLVTVLAGVLIVTRGLRPAFVGTLLVGLVLAVLTKRSTVFLIPYGAFALLLGAWTHYRTLRERARPVVLLGVVLVSTAFVLGVGYALWHFQLLNLPQGRATVTKLLNGEYFSKLGEVPWWDDLVVVFQSFWARLGWLNVYLPREGYLALLAVSVLAAIGWVGYIVEVVLGRRSFEEEYTRLALLFVSTLAVQWAVLFGRELLYLAGPLRMVPQGRYLYPFLPVYGLFFVQGWSWWGRKLRFPAMGAFATVMGLLALSAAYVVVRFYYG